MIRAVMHPALRLMQRLSYPYKFLLVSAFFAVPLVVSIAQLVMELSENIARAERQRVAVGYLREVNELVAAQEYLRDLGTLQFLLPENALKQRFQEQQNLVRRQLLRLSRSPSASPAQALVLRNIHDQVDSFYITPGMEAVRIRIVFSNAQRFIEPVYDFRRMILSQSGLLSGEQLEIFALLDLTSNDLPPILQTLGEARVFGSYYLNGTYIDSEGVETTDALYKSLDKAYSSLSRKMNLLRQEFPHLDTLLPTETFTRPVMDARDYLDGAIIQAVAPEEDWHRFEQRMTDKIGLLYQGIDRILQHIDSRLKAHQQHELRRLIGFLGGLALLIMLFLVMFYAFYRNVRETIAQLRMAALAVARGSYEVSFEVDARDEMKDLADAMEQMRAKLKDREEELRRISTTDALTGLRNRKYFDETLERESLRALRCRHPLALLLIDADHFKTVNDTYGHQAGDAVLKSIADHLMQTATRSSDIVTRYGGEEMAVILPETPIEGAMQLAERIRRRIEQAPYEFEGQYFNVTVSIGVSCKTLTSAGEEQQLVAEADSALYRAKSGGRNRCCIYQDSRGQRGDVCSLGT